MQPYKSEKIINYGIKYLQQYSSESISLLTLIVSLLFLLFALAKWEKAGILMHMCVSSILANIQIMKGANFKFYEHPIPLGNMVYGTLLISIAILTEKYGKKESTKSIFVVFFANIYASIIFMMTLAHNPAHIHSGMRDISHLAYNHLHMRELFIDFPSITLASIVGYYISSYVEIFALVLFKKLFANRYLLIRIALASFIASAIDIICMSYIAWVVLSSKNIGLTSLLYSYILSSYPFRIAISLIAPYIVMIAKRIK